jgi:uncharacterized SAM-binding protein YcdF (DUF218 family)
VTKKLVYGLLLILLLSFIFIEALIVFNGYSQEAVEAEYVIILGAGLRGSEVSLTLKERLLKGIEYMKAYPDSKAIVSGGQGPGETITEAEAMESYLISRGIEAGSIIKEDKASSTWENFLFSRELLNEAEGGAVTRVVVVTSDFHMYRSKLLARRAGFEPYGVSAATPASVKAASHIREYFALVKSFLLDR